MKHLETEIIINAPAHRVWQVLMDFKAYPDWNPFIISIKGLRQKGKNLQVMLRTKKGKEMSFEPVVLVSNQNDEFRWRGKLGIRGIFDGEHYFALEALESAQCRFIHGEFFSGILVGLMGNVLKDTLQSFEEMNKALKNRCEDHSILDTQ